MSGKIKNPERVRWNLKYMILVKYGSQTKFAKLLGISRAQLTHIIVGRNPGYHIRRPACHLLGYPESFLFGDINNDKKGIKEDTGQVLAEKR